MITAILKEVLPQQHPVVQGTRAPRAAGAFTGRTDLNVTSVMGSGTLANLGKLSLPETLTKNAQAMAPGIHRRVAQDSPKVGKAGCATDATSILRYAVSWFHYLIQAFEIAI